VQQALVRLDLGKSDFPIDEMLAMDFAPLKVDGETIVLKIADKVSTDLSHRFREKTIGLSVTYVTDASAR